MSLPDLDKQSDINNQPLSSRERYFNYGNYTFIAVILTTILELSKQAIDLRGSYIEEFMALIPSEH